jgi:hypothetical protein
MLALVASGVWAVEQYREQHQKDREQREAEQRQESAKQAQELNLRERSLRMKFYEEQRPVYLEACKAAAEIAAAKRFADVQGEITRFRVLHFGQMCLVEDQTVLEAMDYFFRGLEQEVGKDKEQGPSTDLRNRSVLLSRACRRSLDLNKVFDVDVAFDPGPVLLTGPYSW